MYYKVYTNPEISPNSEKECVAVVRYKYKNERNENVYFYIEYSSGVYVEDLTLQPNNINIFEEISKKEYNLELLKFDLEPMKEINRSVYFL